MRSARFYSLTDNGSAIAQTVESLFADFEHFHKPPEFSKHVAHSFQSGHLIIFVGAMGIATRMIAPHLRSKHNDPPVIVIDDRGRFVVPLLSGHEGGANEIANQIARQLDAELVVTGPSEFINPRYIVGMGCERGCDRAHLEQLLIDTCQKQHVAQEHILAITSIDIKADEVGLLELCQAWDKPFETYGANQLINYTDRLSVKSDIVFQETGCYGVAESAPLCFSEQHYCQPGELIVTKQKTKRATCAIVRIYLEN